MDEITLQNAKLVSLLCVFVEGLVSSLQPLLRTGLFEELFLGSLSRDVILS